MLTAGSIQLGSQTDRILALCMRLWQASAQRNLARKEGVCELNIDGVSHRMEAGDVGLVTAGDLHFVANAGDTDVRTLS